MAKHSKVLNHFRVPAGVVALLLVLFQVSLAPGQTISTGPGVKLSRHQLHTLIHDARTPEQYRVLAQYFRTRQDWFQQEAKQEKIELQRRQKVFAGVAVKFPSPVDSAQHLLEYYRSMAQQMAAKAPCYEAKANGTA
jgi:hypothetical protein